MLGLGNLLTKSGVIKKFPNDFSFNFDGSNDYLLLPADDNFGVNDTWSVSFWFKSNSISTTQALFNASKAPTATNRIGINLHGSVVRFSIYGTFDSTTEYRAKSSTSLSSDTWYHLVAINSNGTLGLYINNVEQTGTSSYSLSHSARRVIGNAINFNKPFDGLIDEVAIWDTALSASDIAKIYKKPVDFSKASTYATDRTSNLKLWLRAGDKVLPENDTAIARQDFYTDFDNTDDYIAIGSAIGDMSGKDVSVTAWFNSISPSGSTQGIISQQDGTGTGRYLLRIENGKLETFLGGASHFVDIALESNRWYHACYTMNSSTNEYKLYLDGQLGDSGTDPIESGDGDFVIGTDKTLTHYFNGAISNLALYNTTLDAQTISQMAKSRFTPMRDNRFSVVDFDGTTNNTIQTSAHDTLVDTTYTFWAKSDVTGANGGLFGHGGVTKSSFHFNYFSATGGARFFLGGNYYKKWDIDEQDDGQWHHYAIVADADSLTNLKLYVDGVEQTVASSESTGSPEAFTQSLTIGSDATNGNEWEGSIAQFAVYSDLKDDEFIYAQWSKGITADYSNDTNLTGYWRMGDDTSKAYPYIADSSSNSNDGTITNGASDDIVQQMVAGYDLGAFESSSEELGANLIEDSGFDDASYWNAGGDWSVSGSKATSGTGTYDILQPSSDYSLVSGKLYKFTASITLVSGSGNFKFFANDTNIALTLTSGTNTYTTYLTSDGTVPRIRMQGGSAIIEVDNFLVKEVLQSEVSDTYPAIIDVNEPVLGVEEISEPSFASSTGWTLGTGWSISSNTLSSDGSQSAVSNASASITTGAGYYRVVITVDSISSGTIRPNLESWGSYISTTGTSTQFFTLTGNNNLTIQASADFVGSISLASVKEVFGNVGAMTNFDNANSGDIMYGSVLPDQSFLTGVNSAYNFVSFDGTNDYIDCGEIDISSSEITLSAWVYRESTATDDALAGKWNSNGSMFYAPSGGTDVKFHINANVSTATLPTGAWTHVVGTLGDGFRKLYINGEVQDTDADTNSVVNPSGDFYIGRGLWSGGKEFLGNIGQVAYYNKMLTETEVNAIYTLGRHGNLLESYSDNLKGYWAMGALDAKTGLSDTTTTIYDRSGNSNHGTPVSIASSDLKSSPNAEPNGYAKGDTNRSTTTP